MPTAKGDLFWHLAFGISHFSSRRLLLTASRRDAEGLHLPIQVAALDAQRIGGTGDVAVLRGERAQDVFALELLPRVVERQHGRAGAFVSLNRGPFEKRQV